MRLTRDQRKIVREEVADMFGGEARVRLFGSRVDDEARGGDLDLLIESRTPIPEQRKKSLQLTARLQMRLGDQPIDVLILDPETILQPVHEQARRTGVPL